MGGHPRNSTVPGSMRADPGEGGFTMAIDLENLE